MTNSLGFDRDHLYEQRLLEQERAFTSGSEAIRKLNAALSQPANEDNERTYCVDFDGVLAHHESGWPLEKVGEPLEPGIAIAKRIKTAGHRLVVLTARPRDQHPTLEGWLKGHGVRADQVTNVKPPAEAYIDDRAIAWPKNDGNDQLAAEAGVKGMKWGQKKEKNPNSLPKIVRSFSPAGQAKMKAQALEWAKVELKRMIPKLGKDEAVNHVLSTVSREWNVGSSAHVQRKLKISWATKDDPETPDQFGEEPEDE